MKALIAIGATLIGIFFLLALLQWLVAIDWPRLLLWGLPSTSLVGGVVVIILAVTNDSAGLGVAGTLLTLTGIGGLFLAKYF